MKEDLKELERPQEADPDEARSSGGAIQGPVGAAPAQQEHGQGSLLQDCIAEAIDRLLAYDLSGTNHDIYEPRLTKTPPEPGFDYVPYCVYFYYVRINMDGRVQVDHYFYADGPLDDPSQWQQIPYATMKDVVKRLALNARPSVKPSEKNPPRLVGNQDFDPFPFQRKSYVAIFFDEANWQFHQRKCGKPSVVFDPRGGQPNHSFFDAKDLTIEMPNRRTGKDDERSAIFYVNHMKRNADGDDLEDKEEQNFKFDMWLIATFANDPSRRGMSVNFDPGETNQGPPLQP